MRGEPRTLERYFNGDFVKHYPIRDWEGHRVYVDNVGEVYTLAELLMRSPRIGEFQTEFLGFEDRYNNPMNGFSDIDIVLRAISPRFQPSLRQIKIVDGKTHFYNEYMAGSLSHPEYKIIQLEKAINGIEPAVFEHSMSLSKQTFGNDRVVAGIRH